jgi:methyl-accepting chemotaxis protein
MDKVVQQNAANAEESASASEELNAQAEQTMGIVGELSALVGGNRGQSLPAVSLAGSELARRQSGGVGGQKSMHEQAGKKIVAGVPAVRKTKPAAISQGAEVSPDQVIPLDDKDFKDF